MAYMFYRFELLPQRLQKCRFCLPLFHFTASWYLRFFAHTCGLAVLGLVCLVNKAVAGWHQAVNIAGVMQGVVVVGLGVVVVLLMDFADARSVPVADGEVMSMCLHSGEAAPAG